MAGLLISLRRPFRRCFGRFHQHLLQWTRPSGRSLLAGTLTDLASTKSELIAENALLRQQLIILRRQVKRPTCTTTDRLLLLLLARAARNWKQALSLVQPETLLGWHQQVFRCFWRRRSKPASTKPKIAIEIVALIKTMARNNRLSGAERIRGELLKLGKRVSKSTIQKYMRQERTNPSSQTWSNFLHNHARDIWACDFLPVTDLFFRSLFARVASSSRVKVLKTPYHAPLANACCERFLGSVRRECLDHLLILHEQAHGSRGAILSCVWRTPTVRRSQHTEIASVHGGSRFPALNS